MAGDQGPLRDIVRNLEPELQERAVVQFGKVLQDKEERENAAAVEEAVEAMLATDPNLDMEDANKLREWHERRSHPVTPTT
jgi:hypothetical protein